MSHKRSAALDSPKRSWALANQSAHIKVSPSFADEEANTKMLSDCQGHTDLEVWSQSLTIKFRSSYS